MSRRKKAVRRPVPADPRYDSQTVSKFLNNLMERGKKSLAERVFYQAMDLIEQRTGQPGVNIFKQALSNVKPALEVKSRRVGGATYQVPVEGRPQRRPAPPPPKKSETRAQGPTPTREKPLRRGASYPPPPPGKGGGGGTAAPPPGLGGSGSRGVAPRPPPPRPPPSGPAAANSTASTSS